MCLLLGTPFAAVWSQPGVVCSEKVMFDPLTHWAFQKRTSEGQFRGPPTYTHQVWRRSVKGPRRSRGTNKGTNAAQIIVWWLSISYSFYTKTLLYVFSMLITLFIAFVQVGQNLLLTRPIRNTQKLHWAVCTNVSEIFMNMEAKFNV